MKTFRMKPQKRKLINKVSVVKTHVRKKKTLGRNGVILLIGTYNPNQTIAQKRRLITQAYDEKHTSKKHPDFTTGKGAFEKSHIGGRHKSYFTTK